MFQRSCYTFFFFDEAPLCAAANDVKTSVAGLTVDPDKLCVRRTKHHSWKLTAFHLRVKMLTISCFCWHWVSCIQVKTCMFHRMSSENTVTVSCELSGKLWHVFVLFASFENVVPWSGKSLQRLYIIHMLLFPSKPGSHLKHFGLVWLWFIFCFYIAYIWSKNYKMKPKILATCMSIPPSNRCSSNTFQMNTECRLYYM